MATAPSIDETLTPDDAADVLEELLDARNQSYVFGLKLKLPLAEVDSIHSTSSNPRDRLLQVIIAFLKQVQSRDQWKIIVDALNNPVVNLPALAKGVEAAHFPKPTSTRDALPGTPTVAEPVTSTSTDTSRHLVKSKSPPPHSSVSQMQDEIKGFRRKFNSIQMKTIQCLEKCQIAVKTVVFLLTSIFAVGEHKVFLEEKHKSLCRSEDHWELFGKMNFYWNYLSYDLLGQLIEDLIPKESSFVAISEEIADYTADLQNFRQRTTLKLFCQMEPSTEDDPPPGFRKMVVRHDWPDTITLEDVEKFRQAYARGYNLGKCAIMLHSIKPGGSFTVTWIIPVTVINSLMKKEVLDIYKEFQVTRVDIYVQATAICLYQDPSKHETPSQPPSSTGSALAEPSTVKSGSTDKQSAGGEEYSFVDQPSDDLLCPVTCCLLLQPHLTSCCGKHLSQEAATRIQGEGGACPLCNAPDLSTLLNKHFQRQVKELRVFCRHKDQGCVWQGELSELEHHVQSCSMRDTPKMKLPAYCREETEVAEAQETTKKGPLEIQEITDTGTTLLHEAAERGDVEAVQNLITTPIDVNARAKDEGYTALHLASARGHVAVVRLLIQAHALVNIQDETGSTALFLASVNGHVAVVQLLAENGAHTSIYKKGGFSPLFAASQEGHTDVVDILVKAGADVSQTTEDGFSALFVASQEGHTDVVDILVEAGADVNQATTETKNVPLAIAAWKGHTQTVQRLLEARARVNYQDKIGQTPLYAASHGGHVVVVQLLIEKGADISICTEGGASPLYVASLGGHTDVVDILVKAGADVNQANTVGGASPLYVASQEGHTDVVDILVKAGADVNQANTVNGAVPLGIAAWKGHTQTVQRLLEARARVNYQDTKYGRTPMYSASWKGHVAVVQLLIENGANISICNEVGHSPLFAASQEGHTDVVDILVKAGADVNQATTADGASPLYAASQEGHTDVVDILVKAGADVNQATTVSGQTPLYNASWKGHVAVVQLLIENGADISICNKDGFSPLYFASQEGHTDVVDILVKAGADVNQARTMDDGSPLGIAAQQGHTQTVQRLLEARARVNYQDTKSGQTPLFLASWKGHVAVVQLLIENGADISICNKGGASPLYVASLGGHTDVVDILVKAGADVNQTETVDGAVPLGIAAQKGHTQTVQRLLEASARVNYQAKNGSTALLVAGLNGHSEVVKLLLQAGARDIPNKYGYTALSKARANNHSEVVRLLQEHK